MKRRVPKAAVYALLVVVFIASAVFATIAPVEAVFRRLAAVPAVVALVGLLFQMLRDEWAFERQQALQSQQNLFSLGAASHMANVTFDKHVAFCEAYMSEVHALLFTLFREGPTQKALEHASKFLELKREFAAWLTADIVESLEEFEQAVRDIGAKSHLVSALRGTGDPEHGPAVAEMYDVFRSVMALGAEHSGDKQRDVAIEAVKTRIRRILGIEELTSIRRRVVENAATMIRRQSDLMSE